MAKIYRYEFETEDETSNPGPYTAQALFGHGHKYYDIHNRMCNNHNNEETHPSIRFDIDNFDCEYFCACESIELLKKWFRGYNTGLKSIGFKVVEIEVKKYMKTKSRLQCGFKLENIINKQIIEV